MANTAKRLAGWMTGGKLMTLAKGLLHRNTLRPGGGVYPNVGLTEISIVKS